MSVAEEKSGGDGGGLVGRRRRRWSEAQKRQIVAEIHLLPAGQNIAQQAFELRRYARIDQRRIGPLEAFRSLW